MGMLRFCRGKVMPVIRAFIIIQFLLGLFVLMVRNYDCENRVKSTRQDLEIVRASKLVPIKPDDKGGISLPLSHYQKTYPYGTQPNDDNLMIYISSWTIKDVTKKKWFNEGELDFIGCPNLEPWMRCSYSSNRASLNYSKAVLFHGRYLDDEDMPPTRHPRQKWVFYEKDPPPITWNNVDLNKFRSIFNITATYTMDSNIPLLFRRYICQPRTDALPEKTNYALNKRGTATIFSDECQTQSRREDYIQELSKYIQIDIFGKCGKARCTPTEDDDGENCKKDLINVDYKFYLAFEDSFCEGYVTEQFGRLLALNVIPVVMTSGVISSILPPNSYIDVRDFASAKELGEHLKEVNENDALYNKYITAKLANKCRHPSAFSFNCQLCRYLHTNRYNREQAFDVGRFWSVADRCTTEEDFFDKVGQSAAVNEPEDIVQVDMAEDEEIEDVEEQEEEEVEEEEEQEDEDEAKEAVETPVKKAPVVKPVKPVAPKPIVAKKVR